MSTSVSQSSVLFLDSLAYSSRSELFAVTTKELVVWALIVCGIFGILTVILSLWIDHQQPKFSSLTRDCAQ